MPPSHSAVDRHESLDFEPRQRLVHLLVEEVRVTGPDVQIHVRIPLDEPPSGGNHSTRPGEEDVTQVSKSSFRTDLASKTTSPPSPLHSNGEGWTPRRPG